MRADRCAYPDFWLGRNRVCRGRVDRAELWLGRNRVCRCRGRVDRCAYPDWDWYQWLEHAYRL